MKLRRLSTILAAAIALLFVSSAFADKVGVTVEGDENLGKTISEALKADDHEIIDIAEHVKGVKLDAAVASNIGKKCEAEMIVSLRKVGKTMILKVLSTKNDSVQGGVPKSDEDVVDMVKNLIKKIKEA